MIPLLRAHHPSPTATGVHGPAIAALLAAAFLAVSASQLHGQPTAQGRVTGRIVGGKAGESLKGAKVVLVRSTLDASGTPQGSPIQVQDADADGAYVFENVPIDTHSVYQLGTRVDGMLVASESFTFPEGKHTITLNLRLPQVVGDSGSLRIASALIALEPQVGALWITDVVHLHNPTQDVIEGVKAPLELHVPPEAENLDVIRHDPPGGHQRLGNTLLLYGNLQPGITTVVLRYRLPALLGGVTLEKSYPRPVSELAILAPSGQLQVASEHLDPRQPQVLEGQSYDVWEGANLAPQSVVRITARGVPVRQAWLLAPFALFLAIMAGVVFWYVRRLSPHAPGSAE